jgi:hypothetical protein
MVNGCVVNVRRPCEFRAHFREIFRVLGRFPRLQNTFKYIRRFNINQETVHFPGVGGAPPARFCPQ